MSVLFSILLSTIGFVVARYTEDPKAIVQALDNQYAAFWNKKDYAGLASSLFHTGALVIPPDATKFVNQFGLASWLPNMEQYWTSNLSITAEEVFMEEGTESNTIHEIGSYAAIPNKYYQRWTDAGGLWTIAFSSLAIGGAQGGSSISAVNSDPYKIITALDKEFTDLFNKEDFDAVASLYNPGAQLIPPTCDGYVFQPQLASFFQAAHNSGISTIDLKPTVVVQESSTLMHEIGANSINSGPAGPYYVRWIFNGTVWQLAMDIMSIGN